MTRSYARVPIALALGALTATAAALLTAGSAGAATAAAAPKLSDLLIPTTVTAQQGHARFLVGVRTSLPATIIVRVTDLSTKKLMNTVAEPSPHKAGRAFILVQAVDARGYQLPQGSFSVWIGAKGTDGKDAVALTHTIRLAYTTPRGVLDWFTIPMSADVRSSLALHTSTGQFVAAVVPGSAVAKAGIARGDVVTRIDGVNVATGGGLTRALRDLPAGRAVPVVLLRGTTTLTKTLTAPADWNLVPSMLGSLQTTARSKKLAYAYALADYDITQGNTAAAASAMAGWSSTWKATALGQVAQAQLAAAEGQQSAARTHWGDALAKAPGLSAAAFGEGIALDALGNDPAAANAFQQSAVLDPASSSAPAYEALALEQAGLPYLAVAPAVQAVGVDPDDPNALAADGIAWLQTEHRSAGITQLERAIDLTDSASRAQLLITDYLEPAVP